MYELRILSGLHRGAMLPLDDNSLLVGASEDADVVLVDDGVKPRHAMLSRAGSGWLLTAEEGDIFGADSNLRQVAIDLAPGDFARLGEIWIAIVAQDAPWGRHPAVPVDVQFDAEAADEPAAPELNDAAALDSVPPARQEQPDSPAPARKRRRMLLVPVMATVVLSAAAAYALAPKSTQPEGAARNQADMALSPEGKRAKLAAAAAEALNPAAAKQVLTPKELAKAFRKQLADVDLLKRFDLSLDEKKWTMQADLDDEETARFERILPKFMRQHHIAFPVSAKIVSAENMLPFKIRQVISGANANVVTQDGQRLYVGEEYLGVRVVAIQDNRLSFAGKRKIEINW